MKAGLKTKQQKALKEVKSITCTINKQLFTYQRVSGDDRGERASERRGNEGHE